MDSLLENCARDADRHRGEHAGRLRPRCASPCPSAFHGTHRKWWYPSNAHRPQRYPLASAAHIRAHQHARHVRGCGPRRRGLAAGVHHHLRPAGLHLSRARARPHARPHGRQERRRRRVRARQRRKRPPGQQPAAPGQRACVHGRVAPCQARRVLQRVLATHPPAKRGACTAGAIPHALSACLLELNAWLPYVLLVSSMQ